MQLEGVRVLVASDEPRSVGSSLPPMTPLDEPVDQMEAQGRTIPKSKLDLVDAGHVTWEDAADQDAEIITGWWTGGHRRA
jgi:hypothetical protein